jgi:hypothetical protein
MTMCEYWANVYPHSRKGIIVGVARDSVFDCLGAVFSEDCKRADVSALYRVHVKLKPEGAPKRYACEANRLAWELLPNAAAMYAESGYAMVAFPDGSMGVMAENT